MCVSDQEGHASALSLTCCACPLNPLYSSLNYPRTVVPENVCSLHICAVFLPSDPMLPVQVIRGRLQRTHPCCLFLNNCTIHLLLGWDTCDQLVLAGKCTISLWSQSQIMGLDCRAVTGCMLWEITMEHLQPLIDWQEEVAMVLVCSNRLTALSQHYSESAMFKTAVYQNLLIRFKVKGVLGTLSATCALTLALLLVSSQSNAMVVLLRLMHLCVH